jgi:hypothetical protein
MKKFLLMTAMSALTATTAFAQVQLADLNSKENLATDERVATMERPATELTTAAKTKRVKGDEWSLYYTRPAGTLFRGSSSTGGSFYVEYLILPPFYEGFLTNKAKEPAKTKWMNSTNETDYTKYAEENGDFSIGTVGYTGGAWYLYNLVQEVQDKNGNDSTAVFFLTQNSGAVNVKSSYYPRFMVDSLQDASITAYNTGWKRFYSGIAANGLYGWGSLDNKYLLGSGTYTKNDTIWKPSHIIQLMPKPASALYVEDITLFVNSRTEAIKNAGKVRMLIRKFDEKNGYGDIIADLYATVQDTAFVSKGAYDDKKGTKFNYTRYQLTFANEVEDEFGGTVKEPFVINDQFAVIIAGLDSEDVDVDFMGTDVDPDDVENVVQGAVQYFTYNDKTRNIWYGNEMVINMNFNSTFDYVEPWESVAWTLEDESKYTQENANVLKVDAEGNVTAYDEKAAAMNINYVLVQTGFNWYDEFDNDIYYSEELPEWVDQILVNQEDRMADKYKEQPVMVSFKVQPLPAGQTKRAAKFYLQGFGYKSETPIILLQGDATLDDVTGIEAIKSNKAAANASSAIYNLAGQRVDANFKGLVIKDGKKVVLK